MTKKRKKITMKYRKIKMRGLKWQWEKWIPLLSLQEKPKDKWKKKKQKSAEDSNKNSNNNKRKKRAKVLLLKWEELEKGERRELQVGRLWKGVSLTRRD